MLSCCVREFIHHTSVYTIWYTLRLNFAHVYLEFSFEFYSFGWFQMSNEKKNSLECIMLKVHRVLRWQLGGGRGAWTSIGRGWVWRMVLPYSYTILFPILILPSMRGKSQPHSYPIGYIFKLIPAHHLHGYLRSLQTHFIPTTIHPNNPKQYSSTTIAKINFFII